MQGADCSREKLQNSVKQLCNQLGSPLAPLRLRLCPWRHMAFHSSAAEKRQHAEAQRTSATMGSGDGGVADGSALAQTRRKLAAQQDTVSQHRAAVRAQRSALQAAAEAAASLAAAEAEARREYEERAAAAAAARAKHAAELATAQGFEEKACEAVDRLLELSASLAEMTAAEASRTARAAALTAAPAPEPAPAPAPPPAPAPAPAPAAVSIPAASTTPVAAEPSGTAGAAKTTAARAALAAAPGGTSAERSALASGGIAGLRDHHTQLRQRCAYCGISGGEAGAKKLSSCGRCKMVWYCCGDHQKLDWAARHKARCPALKAMREDDELSREGGGAVRALSSAATAPPTLLWPAPALLAAFPRMCPASTYF